MAYSADRKPGELTALTSLATDDVFIVGDTSDVSEVAKHITKANLITDLGTSFNAINRTVTSIAAPTTAGATAKTDYVYLITNTTLTLPTAVGNTNKYTVKCISGTCVVDGDGAETIDGTANITIQVEDSVDLISNNTEWKVV